MLKKIIIVEIIIWNIYLIYKDLNYYISIPTGIESAKNILPIEKYNNHIHREAMNVGGEYNNHIHREAMNEGGEGMNIYGIVEKLGEGEKTKEIIGISIIIIIWIIFNIFIKNNNILTPSNPISNSLLNSTSKSTSKSTVKDLNSLQQSEFKSDIKPNLWRTEINIIILILVITIIAININDLFQIFILIEIMSFCSYAIIFSSSSSSSYYHLDLQSNLISTYQENMQAQAGINKISSMKEKNIQYEERKNDIIYLIISIISSILMLIYIIFFNIKNNTFNIFDYTNILNNTQNLSPLSTTLPILWEGGNNNISPISLNNNSPISLNNNYEIGLEIFLIIGILNKIGIMPFHYWVKRIYRKIDKIKNIVIMVVPKIFYILIIYNIFGKLYLFNLKYILLIIISYSLIFGAISGIYENNIIKILASSSFINISLLLIPLILSLFYINIYTLPLEYLILYSIGTICILYIPTLINNKKINNVSDLSKTNFNPYIAWFIIFVILSLIGLPPLGGFFGKLNILYLIFIENNLFSSVNLFPFSSLWENIVIKYTLILIILFSTVISISFYLKFIRYYMVSNIFSNITNNNTLYNNSNLHLFKNNNSFGLFSFLLFFLLFYSLFIPILYPIFGNLLIL